MEHRSLGKSDVKVSEVSLGCWTMGGLNWVDGTPNGWANVDEAEITRAIKVAIDSGVHHFDNADVYGNGRAERMLAKSFSDLGLNSNDFVIATKVGHHKGTAHHAYEPAHIRHQCEQSLINLKREYVDVYYFHHGNFGEDDVYLDDAVHVVNRLVQEGKIRVKGLSAYNEDDFERLSPKIQPSVFQSWAHALDYKFVQPGSRVSNLMAKDGITFVAFSPLAQGRLLDKYDPKNPPEFEPGDNRKDKATFSGEALASLKPKLEQIKEKFGHTTEDLASVALRFILSMPSVSCVIPGFRNERQVKCNLAATNQAFSQEELDFISSVYGS